MNATDKKMVTQDNERNRIVYVVTELDNYGRQLFKGVFTNRDKAIEYLDENGLKESAIDEINKIELE